jgi:TolA-binding protein
MQYWLGESYYVRGGYADAADSYIASMKRDPRGLKAPDAMVRLASVLRELGKVTEACATLGSFPGQYPDAPQIVKDKAAEEAARTGC